jgi:hypothetical protein
MAFPVYSRRLFSVPSFSGGPFTAFTAPAGFTTVVKTITIVWGDVTLSDLDAWVQLLDLTKLTRITIHGGSSVPEVIGGALLWNGSMAMDEADELQIQTADGTCDFAASGYALSLP